MLCGRENFKFAVQLWAHEERRLSASYLLLCRETEMFYACSGWLTKLYIYQVHRDETLHGPALLENGWAAGCVIPFLFIVTVVPQLSQSAWENMKAWHTHGLSFLRLFPSKMVKRSTGWLQLEVPLMGGQQMTMT